MAEPDFSYSTENFKKLYEKLKTYDFPESDGEVDRFLTMLKEKTPFAFSRFNDGEMSAFRKGDGERIGRTQHTVIDDNLRDHLKKAMSHQQENYWVGLPCFTCFPELHEYAIQYVSDDYPYKTRAVALTNRNWGKFVSEFADSIKDRTLYSVCSSDQNLEMMSDVFGLEFSGVIRLPSINAWDYYDQIKNSYENFESGSVVALSCGPMSRILAPEWFSKRPDVTYIGVGSVFDPFTRNIWHSCHKGWMEGGFNNLPRCEGCN